MPEPKIRVAIFSYNRPDHLANCLRSLKDLWPEADVVVYDDNSKHPGMKAVFEEYGVPVVVGKGGKGRHGGLYENMQAAYEEACSSGFDYLLKLQDDMQLVRPVSPQVLEEYFQAFAKDPSLTQIDPRFSKTPRKKKNRSDKATPSAPGPAPFRAYLDVGFFKLDRLQKLNWSFLVEGSQIISGELTLSLRAAELGMRKADPRTPFTMHLPFPHLYRHRLRLPRLSGLSGKIFRFEYMTEEDRRRMDSRPEGSPAYWREQLTIAGATWFDSWLLSGKDDSKILA